MKCQSARDQTYTQPALPENAFRSSLLQLSVCTTCTDDPYTSLSCFVSVVSFRAVSCTLSAPLFRLGTAKTPRRPWIQKLRVFRGLKSCLPSKAHFSDV